MLINPFKTGGSDGPTGSYIEIQICGGSTTYILEDTLSTGHSDYYAPAVNDTRLFQITSGGNYYCGDIQSITATGSPVGRLVIDGSSGSYTCLACTDDLVDGALVYECENLSNLYAVNTDGTSYSVDEIVTFDVDHAGLSDACGKVHWTGQHPTQAGTSMSLTGATSCCECVGDCLFEVTDCNGGGTSLVEDSYGYMPTIGDFIAWSDGGSTYCGEVTDDNQSGTSAGYVTYQGYMDCADCNSSEGL